MLVSSSEAVAIAPNPKVDCMVPLRSGREAAFAPARQGRRRRYFANNAFIVSSSTSVETEASSGRAGLHMPLTTGFILKGTSILVGTSWPAFFIIAAVRAKRD